MAKLKRWESPRQQGRNVKGRGGSAKLRQIRKKQKTLRKKLISQEKGNHSPFFLLFIFIAVAITGVKFSRFSSIVRTANLTSVRRQEEAFPI